MDIAQFLSIAGAGAIIVALVEALKRAGAWDDQTTSRIAPLLSILLGVTIVTIGSVIQAAGAITAEVIYGGVLSGVIAGATSAGIYNTVGKPVVRAVAGEPGGY